MREASTILKGHCMKDPQGCLHILQWIYGIQLRKVGPLPLSWVVACPSGWFAERMLSKEAASKPDACKAVSRAGIGALEVASATGRLGVLSCWLDGSFADAPRTYSTEKGTVDKESTAFCRRSVWPSVRALAKCFGSLYCSAAHSSG